MPEVDRSARGQNRRFAAMLALAGLAGILLAVAHAPFWAGFIPVGLLGSFGTAYVVLGRAVAHQKRYRTKTGKVLTAADIRALADEAEQGYDVERLGNHPLFGEDARAYLRKLVRRGS